MLSFYLRFALLVFSLSSISHCTFDLTSTDPSLPRDQCRSGWHYLPGEMICILFATTEAGDPSWYDGYKACETSSAQLVILSDSSSLTQLEQAYHQRDENQVEIYLEHLQQGAWIGKAKWSETSLCDSTRTTREDLELNCYIITERQTTRSLCLQQVPCEEKHPFICQTTPITREEALLASETESRSWKCLINLIWCIVDKTQSDKEKAKQAAAAAAAAAELEAYKEQFIYALPENVEVDANGQPILNPQAQASGSESIHWLFLVGGGLVAFLFICLCCTAAVYAYRKMAARRSPDQRSQRQDSFDSSFSTVSR